MQDINARIAARVRALRAESALSLEALASRCSRQPLDDVAGGARRNQPRPQWCSRRSPPASDAPSPRCSTTAARLPTPVSRGAERTSWKDPQSGYVRRNISPPNFPSPIRIVDVDLSGRRAGVL